MPTHDSPWHETREGYFLSLHQVNNSFAVPRKFEPGRAKLSPKARHILGLTYLRRLWPSDAEDNAKAP
jgi:hypothetical protein